MGKPLGTVVHNDRNKRGEEDCGDITTRNDRYLCFPKKPKNCEKKRITKKGPELLENTNSTRERDPSTHIGNRNYVRPKRNNSPRGSIRTGILTSQKSDKRKKSRNIFSQKTSGPLGTKVL